MRAALRITLIAVAALAGTAAFHQYAAPPGAVPAYDRDGHMAFPAHYREWVYLSTGFDMSYQPGAPPDQHKFDNVFVNPEAYQAFLSTGTWPDKTTLVLEVRGARDRGSINQRGNYQAAEVVGIEVHVKDAARFPGQWAFFDFDEGKPGKLFPPSADCYSCHAAHGAVDTTFVQFYPTLLPIARKKGTLAGSYLGNP